MNVKFWTYHNGGYVKITLKPDQSLEHYDSWAHEEGYSWRGTKWTYSGQWVFCKWGYGGRDCDGRLDHSSEDRCHVSRLKDHVVEVDPEPVQEWKHKRAYPDSRWAEYVLTPDWQESEPTRVYDQYAQMAGY